MFILHYPGAYGCGMIVRELNPNGFTILKSKEMATNVQNAKDTFCKLARKPDDHEELNDQLLF